MKKLYDATALSHDQKDSQLAQRTVFVAVCILLVWSVLCATPKAGWSAGSDEPEASESLENTVNPQQMPDNSFLYDTSIYDLLNADSAMEGNTVQVTGEVIGDAIYDMDDTKAWITLASTDPDKQGSLSVYVDRDDLDLIDTYGKYGKRGTILRVKGVFHLSSPTHQGSTDIHADTVTAVAPGRNTAAHYDLMLFVPGLILVILGVSLTGWYYLLRERQR